MTERLSGGEMLIRALQDEGVEYIFGYPGGAALHIYDAVFKQQRIEHILVRHEQAATHMADGYARSTGKPGVVLVTSGPGATNAITGLATAFMDSTPIIVISAQVPNEVIGTDAFQETDMVGVSRPVVKHSYMVKSADEIPRVVKEAFYIASSGRPGPIVIDIPKDTTDPNETFDYDYPESVSLRSYSPATRGHGGQIRKAVAALLAAKRPVIYTGGGIVQGEAGEMLTAIARKLGYPVTNTLMGLGGYPGTDRQFLGMLGMHGTFEANMAMHHTDLIFAAGARFDDRVTNNPDKFAPGRQGDPRRHRSGGDLEDRQCGHPDRRPGRRRADRDGAPDRCGAGRRIRGASTVRPSTLGGSASTVGGASTAWTTTNAIAPEPMARCCRSTSSRPSTGRPAGRPT